METTTSFGYWVRRHRKALDLTQAELAQCVVCATGTIKHIEADERRPSRQLADRLATCLHIPAEERPAFLKAARTELSPDRLSQTIQLPNNHNARQVMPHLDLGDVPHASTHIPAVPSQLAPLRHNLPALLTPLIGREQELANLTTLFRRPEIRLVTVTGPGGVGKTHLALMAAATLLEDESALLLARADQEQRARYRFPHGGWFVDLALLRDPGQVAPTIARVLGVPEMGEQPVGESLKVFLRTKILLLVLDNVEHMLEAAALMSDLLHAAPGMAVLATSRAPLGLVGERVVLLDPLAEPEAVKLFVAKAQAVRLAFTITAANTGAITSICRLLDGLPLAIELGAARARLLEPSELLDLLQVKGRLPLLTGGARDLPARQRTIRATIAWSYNLLGAAEQALFRRLGVFADGFTLRAAAMIGTHDSIYQAVELLGVLVDYSLVRRRTHLADEPRFALLETVREYALEQLVEHCELAEAQRRQAASVMALVEEAEPQLLGPAQGVWRSQLAAEHANIEVALAWSQEAAGDAEIGLRIAGALLWYWKPQGYRREGLAWLDRLLAACPDAAPAVRAKALHAAGTLAGRQGQYTRAQALLEQALALSRSTGDIAAIALNLNRLCALARERGHYEHAHALAEETLAFARAHRLDAAVVGALMGLGDVALEQGALALALHWYWEVLPLARVLGDTQLLGWIQANLGRAMFLQGDVEQALGLFEASRQLFEHAALRDGVCVMLLELGRVALHQGDPAQAAHLLVESLSLAQQLWMPQVIALDLETLAEVAFRREQAAFAAGLLGAAAALRADASAEPSIPERKEIQRMIDNVRVALGDPTFVGTWEAGGALTMEQAIAYALETSQ